MGEEGLDNAGFHVEGTRAEGFAALDAEGHFVERAGGVDGVVVAEDEELAFGAGLFGGGDAEVVAAVFLGHALDFEILLAPLSGNEFAAAIGGDFVEAGRFGGDESAKSLEHLRLSWLERAIERFREGGAGHGANMLATARTMGNVAAKNLEVEKSSGMWHCRHKKRGLDGGESHIIGSLPGGEWRRRVRGFATGVRMILDTTEIQKILPHRYPFLMVDAIEEIERVKRIVGVKNVTINEAHFQGHFPGAPIMPGVLIIESMAQTGGLLLLMEIPDRDKKLLYFVAIDGARFRRPVVPGEQLKVEMKVISWRGDFCKLDGRATVNGELAAEAILMCKMVDREAFEKKGK